MLTLRPKTDPTPAFSPDGFLPEKLAAATLAEVQAFQLSSDGQPIAAGELFDIAGNPANQQWRFEADLTNVARLGEGMTTGTIHVTGGVGDRAGARMRGGKIIIQGQAAQKLGTEMRRGLIAARGAVGQLAGYRMRAGTILTLGPCGPRVGAEMVRGTIGLFGNATPDLLPTFRYACDFEPAWLTMLAESTGFDLPRRVALYGGDLLCGGRGEVLLPVG